VHFSRFSAKKTAVRNGCLQVFFGINNGWRVFRRGTEPAGAFALIDVVSGNETLGYIHG